VNEIRSGRDPPYERGVLEEEPRPGSRCARCGSPAAALFWFAQGCACSSERLQPLCAQHAFRAAPVGSMELVQDLTIGAEFTAAWTGESAR
jgi:hypothetical protein